MKSGLWILIVVIVIGAVVGAVIKGRMKPPEAQDDAAAFKEIQALTDSKAKVAGLQDFIAEYPDSKQKPRAYSLIGRELLGAQRDTAAFLVFAEKALREEADGESRSHVYYHLYSMRIETKPEEAFDTARQLLRTPLDVAWLYNFIGYDLAERNVELDLALAMAEKSLTLAESAEDSAMFLDSRGYVYYVKGVYPDAIRDYEQSIALAPEPFEESLKHLGYSYLRVGDKERTFQTFKRLLVMGEYGYARSMLDSLMTADGYTRQRREAFEESIWQERMAAAEPAKPFDLVALDGSNYRFDPNSGNIMVLNFFSPT